MHGQQNIKFCVSIFKRHLEGSLEKVCFTHFTSFSPNNFDLIRRHWSQNKTKNQFENSQMSEDNVQNCITSKYTRNAIWQL